MNFSEKHTSLIVQGSQASEFLQGQITIDIEKIFTDEYPSKPDGHNWPRSYEQYKNQVGGLQEDMDAVYETLEEYEEAIEELQKLVSNLRVEVAKKKDK